jgi:hypothetical protein
VVVALGCEKHGRLPALVQRVQLGVLVAKSQDRVEVARGGGDMQATSLAEESLVRILSRFQRVSYSVCAARVAKSQD